MNVIDTPVDALVFDYVRIGIFTVVNNVWTWVAVVTAAVSFWRITAGAAPPAVKSSSCAVKPEPKRTAAPARIDREPNGFCQTAASVETSRLEPVNEPSSSLRSSSPWAAVSGFCEDNGVSFTKGKFVVYYDDERGDDGSGDGDGEGAVMEWGNGDGCGEWWGSWEKVLQVRTGEMGWCRYQDLTAINGNVVRLWDGVRRDNPVW